MTINFYYDRAENVVLSQAYGQIASRDFLAFCDRLEEEKPAIGFRSFSDYRRADVSGLNREDVERIKSRRNEVAVNLGGKNRLALIVSGPLSFGLGRMFEQTQGIEELNISVFHSHEEALAWLELTAEKLEEIAVKAGFNLNLTIPS